jgi:hypothetical protein
MPSPSSNRIGVLIAALAISWASGSLHAQRREVAFELGGSTVRPPVGVEGNAASFLVAGLRAIRMNRGGTGLQASVLGGYSLDDLGGGDFFSGTVEGSAWRPVGKGWSLGIEATGFGFKVSEPFPYQAVALEQESSLRFSGRNVLATLAGVAGVGWSRTELRRTAHGNVRTVDDRLWRYGVEGEVLAGTAGVWAGAAAGIHESLGGRYLSGGMRVLFSRGNYAVEGRLDAWETPEGNETVAGIAMVLPLGDWSLRGFLGRTEPDPLTLAEPSAGAGGLLLGRRIFGSDPLGDLPPPIHEVLGRSGDHVTIRIRIQGPSGIDRLELVGDFTLWEPLAMTRDGEGWVTDLETSAGVYHFGFLADGEWYLPEDAPDLVSDEWGRENATLVIQE